MPQPPSLPTRIGAPSARNAADRFGSFGYVFARLGMMILPKPSNWYICIGMRGTTDSGAPRTER